jgi:broad specificity phosphatase PhoE
MFGERDPKKFCSEYFDKANEPAMAERKEALVAAMTDISNFLREDNGQVALLDGQAASSANRATIEFICQSYGIPVRVIYIEIVMADSTATEIFKYERSNSPIDDGMYADETEALNDFTDRVQRYRQDYDPITAGSFIRVVDSSEFIVRGLSGFLPSRLVGWMLNLSIVNQMRHPILFCRHGESCYNLENRVGGDPELTQEGEKDAASLHDFIKRCGYEPSQLTVWTSRLKRTIQTAQPLENAGYKITRFRELNEIHAGICEGLTYDEIQARYPSIAQWRSMDKYTFRYPGGESYQDLVLRLEPVIMELETAKTPVLVVSHQAVLRALFAYFFNAAAHDSVNMDVPHATVWRVLGAGGPKPTTERIPLRKRPTHSDGSSYRTPPSS